MMPPSRDNNDKNIFDRRKTTRVDYQHEVDLVSETGQTCRWKILDISLKGLQVEGGDLAGFELGALVKYQILLPGSLDHKAIAGDGKVVWKSETGKMGVKFMDTTALSLENLRRLVELNVGDADKIEKELQAFADDGTQE